MRKILEYFGYIKISAITINLNDRIEAYRIGTKVKLLLTNQLGYIDSFVVEGNNNLVYSIAFLDKASNCKMIVDAYPYEFELLNKSDEFNKQSIGFKQ